MQNIICFELITHVYFIVERFKNLSFTLIVFFSQYLFQLDLCQKMAGFPTRTSAGSILWSSFPLCMDNCYFTSRGAYCMGMLVNCDIRPRYYWSSCCNGWSCSTFGILCCNALVENTMAKLKYVFLLHHMPLERIGNLY